ncbi:MAG: hypothetical protein ABTD50_02655 [Polyangiaceae bacterium]|jgi:hypothetical protein
MMSPRRFDSARLAFAAYVVATFAGSAAAAGCATLSPPFNGLKDAPMTVYRLQNYEPPAPSAQATGGLALPPQIMQWIAAGASLLPPGLLPPGLLQGSAAPQPPADGPRFHSFRILGYEPIVDSGLKSDVLDAFGHSANFQPATATCLYPEFGFAIAQPSGAPADILLSFSCAQVQSYNFAWPYAQTGLTPDASKKFASIIQRAFPGTAVSAR